MKHYVKFLWIGLFLVFTGADCEVGTNPIIFDVEPTVVVFNIETENHSFSDFDQIDLNDVLADIDYEVEQISLFNITIEIDQLVDTSPAATVSGFIAVDGFTLLSVQNVQLGDFAAERSIFDPALGNSVAAIRSTVEYLEGVLNGGFIPIVSAVAQGSSSEASMQFRMRLRIYSQVHAKP
jgi:hypothetical protein